MFSAASRIRTPVILYSPDAALGETVYTNWRVHVSPDAVIFEDTGMPCAAVGHCRKYQAEVTGTSPWVPTTETIMSPPSVRVVGPPGSTELMVGI